MKKEDVFSLIIYVIMIGFAIIVGMSAVSPAFTNLYSKTFISPVAFCIITLIISVLVNVCGLELFHVIGGKLGGYKTYSINILGFSWTKKENKWHFAFKDFDGLTGETKVAPKSEKSKLNWFVYLPLIMYFFELALGLVIYNLGVKETTHTSPLKWMAISALLNIIISSMIALYNFIPLHLDSMTDGYRLMLISNKTNSEALNEILRVEALQLEGKNVDNIKVFEEITDFTANVNLFAVYEALSIKDYKRAEELIEMILAKPEKVQELTLNRLLAQLVYIKIINSSREEAKKFYDENLNDKVRRFICNDTSMESLRAYALIAGVLDKSQGEVVYSIGRKTKAIKNTTPTRLKIEEQLFDEAISLIKKEHPDWELDKK